ncbi:hypothetical protein [Clostridium gasigenes]|uniref:hypothetical protein n=1 Tax=Clostridium gasigenes TaxID=94869 RepID=UPI00111378C8|nr:hypothetical protein [Clostridium gasigenes]
MSNDKNNYTNAAATNKRYLYNSTATLTNNQNDFDKNMAPSTNSQSDFDKHITTPTNSQRNLDKHTTIPTNSKRDLDKHTTTPTNSQRDLDKHTTTPTNSQRNLDKHTTIPTNSQRDLDKHTTIPTNSQRDLDKHTTTPTNSQRDLDKHTTTPTNSQRDLDKHTNTSTNSHRYLDKHTTTSTNSQSNLDKYTPPSTNSQRDLDKHTTTSTNSQRDLDKHTTTSTNSHGDLYNSIDTHNHKKKKQITSSIKQLKKSDILKVSKLKNISCKNDLPIQLPKVPLNLCRVPLLIGSCHVIDIFTGSLKFSYPINNVVINLNKIVITNNYLLADNFMGASSALFYFEGYLKTTFYTLEPNPSSKCMINSSYKDNIIYIPFTISKYLNIGYLLENECYLLENPELDITNFTYETSKELMKVNDFDKHSNSYNNCNLVITLDYSINIYSK